MTFTENSQHAVRTVGGQVPTTTCLSHQIPIPLGTYPCRYLEVCSVACRAHEYSQYPRPATRRKGVGGACIRATVRGSIPCGFIWEQSQGRCWVRHLDHRGRCNPPAPFPNQVSTKGSVRRSPSLGHMQMGMGSHTIHPHSWDHCALQA